MEDHDNGDDHHHHTEISHVSYSRPHNPTDDNDPFINGLDIYEYSTKNSSSTYDTTNTNTTTDDNTDDYGNKNEAYMDGNKQGKLEAYQNGYKFG